MFIVQKKHVERWPAKPLRTIVQIETKTMWRQSTFPREPWAPCRALQRAHSQRELTLYVSSEWRFKSNLISIFTCVAIQSLCTPITTEYYVSWAIQSWEVPFVSHVSNTLIDTDFIVLRLSVIELESSFSRKLYTHQNLTVPFKMSLSL